MNLDHGWLLSSIMEAPDWRGITIERGPIFLDS